MAQVLLNHKLVDLENAKVSILDRGYVFGDGIYEVIRFYKGTLFRFEEHLERLKRSLKEVDIRCEMDSEELLSEMDYLIQNSGYRSGYIYLQVSRGVGKRDHVYVGKNYGQPQILMYAVQEEERPLLENEKGIKVLITKDIRWSRCDVKSLSLLGAVMAKNDAIKKGASEAVLSRDGYITEGSATNVFAVKEGVLYTHPANEFILNGITRLTVIQAAEELGIPVVETPFLVEFFRNADEAFTTASISEIKPIVEYVMDVEGGELHGFIGNAKIGDITWKLHRKFNEYVS